MGNHIVTEDFLIESNGLVYAGNHLLIDLYDAHHLDDVDHIENVFNKCFIILQFLKLDFAYKFKKKNIKISENSTRVVSRTR